MASPLRDGEPRCDPALRRHRGRSHASGSTIDAERVRRFLDATGDAPRRESPRHAVDERAGHLLLSLVPDLLPRLIVLAGWTRGVNAGVDDCRFPAPVPVGLARAHERASSRARAACRAAACACSLRRCASRWRAAARLHGACTRDCVQLRATSAVSDLAACASRSPR